MAGKKILPRNVNGHIQALRLQLISKDLDSDKAKWVKKEEKAGGQDDLSKANAPLSVIIVPMDALKLDSTMCNDKETTQNVPVVDVSNEEKSEDVLAPELDDNVAPLPGSIRFSADTAFIEGPDRPRWTEPLKPWDTVYRAGEDSELTIAPPAKWSPGALPPEIEQFNFTSMEDGMRGVFNVDDGWKSDYLLDTCADLDFHIPSTNESRPLDSRSVVENPALVPELVPFVQEYMRLQEVTPSCDLHVLYRQDLGVLRDGGSEHMSQQAAAALIMWSERHPRSAGKNEEQMVNWGDRYPCIDYVAQELSIGDLYILRIDMGYELPLGAHLGAALWEPGKIEKNQCVCTRCAGYGVDGAGQASESP